MPKEKPKSAAKKPKPAGKSKILEKKGTKKKSSSATMNNKAGSILNSDAFFKVIFEGAIDGILISDEHKKFFMANKIICRMLGYSEEELTSLSVKDIHPKDDLPRVNDQFMKLIKGEIDIAMNLPVKRKDGLVFFADIAAYPFVIDGKGGLIGFFRDVTERNRITESLNQSEERFRNIVASSPMGIHMYTVNSAGELVFDGYNNSANRMLGVENSQFMGKTITEAFPPLAQTEVPSRYLKTALENEPWSTEQISYEHENIMGAFHIYAFQTKPGSMAVMFLDITERKKVEEEMQKLASIAQNSSELINLSTLDGRMVYLNEAGCAMLGIDHEDVEKTNIMQVIPKHLAELVQSELFPSLKNSGAWQGELQYRNLKTGDLTTAYATIYVINDKNTGTARFLANISLDITERKKLELELIRQKEELQAANEEMEAANEELQVTVEELNHTNELLASSEERSRIISEMTTDYLFVVEINDKGLPELKWASENMARITGSSIDHVASSVSWMKIIHPDDAAAFGEFMKNLIVSRKQGEFECRSLLNDGSMRWINIFVKPKVDASHKFTITGAVKDITERKKAEIALAEREQQMTTLISNLPGMVYRCRNDRDWTMQFISEGCLKLTGYEKDDLVDNKKITYNDLVLPEYQGPLWGKWQKLLAERLPFEEEYPIRTASGEVKWVWERGRGIFDKDGNLLYLEGYIEDITDRRKAQDMLQNANETLELRVSERTAELVRANEELKEVTSQLVQSGKMAALGELTAGIAHELNQPLNSISIIAQALLRDIQKERLNTELLNEKLPAIVTQVNRMADIIKHMRIFTRQYYADSFQPVDVNEVIKGAFTFIEQQMGSNDIAIRKELGTTPRLVNAHEIGLEQVVLNILSNARYALIKSRKSTKELTVRVVEEGDFIRIVFLDNGDGITKENMDKLFNPFFTTKEPGEGTGLGLSVSRKIIEEHKGKIEVTSTPGEFARFDVVLPRVR